VTAADPAVAAAVGRALALLEELVRISSPSGDRAGGEAAARRYAAELGVLGLAARVEPWPGADGEAPVVVAGAAEAAGALLAIGHLDTVLDAAPPRRDGDRLFATGAIDMKGGLAAFAGALALLAARGGRPPSDLALVVVPDEEVSGPISHAATRRFGATARALWVLEPGSAAAEDAETIVVGRRGLVHWTLEARGRAAHAGVDFARGRSALAAAAEWVLAAERATRPGHGPTVNPARLVAGDRESVLDAATLARLAGGAGRVNVVPDLARLDGEARFFSFAERDAVVAELAAAAGAIGARRGVELELSPGNSVPPLEPTPERIAAGARAVALAAARGWRLELETHRGGISFPNFLPPGSTIPVLDGLGPVGDGMHTRDEHLLLPSLARRVELLADLLAAEG
jgi:glutamate carboxypeptidase